VFESPRENVVKPDIAHLLPELDRPLDNLDGLSDPRQASCTAFGDRKAVGSSIPIGIVLVAVMK